MHDTVTPNGIADPVANFAHARLTDGATRWLHTSGVVPIAPDGSTPIDVGDQAEVIWTAITAMLSDAEMTPSDVISVVTYVTPGQDLEAVMAVRDRALGETLAASTLGVVAELVRPEWLMEIAVIAAN